MNRKKILVVLGGNSREREISIKTGKACLAAIKRNDKIIIPIRNTDLKIGDELLFFTKSEDIYKAEQLF